MTSGTSFVCPGCRSTVTLEHDTYVCTVCARRYPVLLGIPDFRITPDPWLSIEDDRQKGLTLDARTRGAGFRETVEAYWAMTPGTSSARARRFTEHVIGGEARSREWLSAHALDAVSDSSPWVDLGCGTADLAVAVARQRPVVAIDIAFRWLVAAQRRLRERGVDNVTLVCADAGCLPLPDRVAGGVVSLGLLEHVASVAPIFGECARILAPGGRFHLRTTNRYSILREPHVNVWGVGFVPVRFADHYVKWRSGDRYLHLRPSSARTLRRTMRAAGLDEVTVRAAPALPSDAARLGTARVLVGAYNRIIRLPLARRAIAAIAPLLEAQGRRR